MVSSFLLIVMLSAIINPNQADNGKTSSLPNIVFMLTDDLGWNSMWNNNETYTPTLDSMVSSSLLLNSFYVYKYCSPTRGSFLSGRFPYKLCATQNNLLPPSRKQGINLGYTYITEKLKLANPPYISYQVGKWHQGIFNFNYTPIGRGFNKSFGYLSGGENHFTQQTGGTKCSNNTVIPVDLYNSTHPAFGQNDSYNGYMFTNVAIEFIEQHAVNTPDQPFFLYYALQNTHGPIQAPQSWINMYNFNETVRNTFDAMESIVDDSVKNITQTLKRLKLWDNTLFIWTTDNGSPTWVAGSNKPFRGAKGNNFEGGVHVPGLISGGVLPSNMIGKQLNGMMHITDFYATFCYLAGDIDPNDKNPDSPSPIDSINMWPYISGNVKESPRSIIVHDHLMYTNITQGAIRNEQYKLVIMNESTSSWYGQFSPNNSWNPDMRDIYACSVNTPCLFDVVNDPTEHIDLSEQLPNVTKSLTELFYSFNKEYHPPKREPPNDVDNYCNAVEANKGFVVPWIN
eukprot:357976_1